LLSEITFAIDGTFDCG